MVLVYDDMNLIAVERGKDRDKSKHKYPIKPYRDEYVAGASKNKGQRATFNKAMRLTIIIGQSFGLMPVLGVLETDSSKLRFSMFSWRCMYSYLSIIGQSLLIVTCLIKLFMEANSASTYAPPFIFYSTNGITTILFLYIAIKWPKLCQHISKIEAADPNVDDFIVKKCNYSCILVLSLAALEHILSDVSGIAVAMACQPDKEVFTAFTLQAFPFLWSFVDHHHVTAIMALVLIFNMQCTFNWNFANVFVICISWYLESRIQQINNRLNSVRGKHVSSVFWRSIREDYSKVTNLVRKVDDVISGIIFLTFANNLYYICWQLLHVLEEGFHVEATLCGKTPEERPMMHGYEQVAYFAYSFFFLMGRSLAVSLIAARVHSASKVAAQALYDVPASAYCIEVQRFIDQVHGDNVALSGLQFFNVKRGLVLAIGGTIITYELVLMQFTGVSTPTSAPPLAQIILSIPNSTASTTP